MTIMADNLPAVPSAPTGSPSGGSVAPSAGGSGAAPPAAPARLPFAPHGATLSETALTRGRTLESWMGDPKSPYWRGDEYRSAKEYQAEYAALLRGQLAGKAGRIGPDSNDTDQPLRPNHATGEMLQSVDGYDLTPLHGHIRTAEDRDILDGYLAACLEAEIGQQKMASAAVWALTQGNPSSNKFEAWARGQGWSDRQIAAVIRWHRKEAAEH